MAQKDGTMTEIEARLMERIERTTAELVRIKTLCSELEEATGSIVSEIFGKPEKCGMHERDVDMTKPQPCTKYRDAERMAWIAKLIEETHEVVQEAQIVAQLEKADEEALSTVLLEARKRLAMELTDVKTLCESWLYAEGWDEEERGELQRLVNEKNKERGYF